MSYLKISVLGTSASYPTADRNVTALHVQTPQRTFLLDVGENTQRQLLKMNLALSVDCIIISHFHLDHWWGLIPLIRTLQLNQRKDPLKIYCPDKTYLLKIFNLLNININQEFEINIVNIIPNIQYIEGDSIIKFYNRVHTTKTYGIHLYSLLQEKYDKEKLYTVFNDQEIKAFFKSPERSLLKDSVTYQKKDFLLNEDSYFNLYYSSDGLWDDSILQIIKKGVLITECTHYFEKDELICRKKAHTHFKDILRSYNKGHLKDITTVLVHLGSKITEKIIMKENQRLSSRNIYFAKDMMVINQDNLKNYVSVGY